MSPARWAVLALGVVITLAGLGLGLPQLLSGDHEEYGRVAIPGRGTVDLPAEKVVVFYEDGSSPADGFFSAPDVDWRIRPESGGAPLELDGDDGLESNVRDDGSWTDIESLEIEEAGEYEVEVRPVAGGPDPALTFGTSGVTLTALLFVIVGAGIGTTLIALALAARRG